MAIDPPLPPLSRWLLVVVGYPHFGQSKFLICWLGAIVADHGRANRLLPAFFLGHKYLFVIKHGLLET